QITMLIQNHPIREKNEGDEPDQIIIGLFTFAQIIFLYDPSLKEDASRLIYQIFDPCLFQLPSADNRNDSYLPPKCKTKTSREAAFQVLLESCKDNFRNFDIISHL